MIFPKHSNKNPKISLNFLMISSENSTKKKGVPRSRTNAGHVEPPRRTPFVELPLGATEDRVTGTIDIERALKEAGKVPKHAETRGK